MKKNPTRRALQAVANITLTIGLGGCIQDAPMFEVDAVAAPDVAFMLEADAIATDIEAEADEHDAAWADPDEADAGWADAERSDTAWPDADAPDAATPDGALADAGGDALVCGINADPADWVACCEAQSPENNAHCSAWGPPVPPAMEVA